MSFNWRAGVPRDRVYASYVSSGWRNSCAVGPACPTMPRYVQEVLFIFRSSHVRRFLCRAEKRGVADMRATHRNRIGAGFPAALIYLSRSPYHFIRAHSCIYVPTIATYLAVYRYRCCRPVILLIPRLNSRVATMEVAWRVASRVDCSL